MSARMPTLFDLPDWFKQVSGPRLSRVVANPVQSVNPFESVDIAGLQAELGKKQKIAAKGSSYLQSIAGQKFSGQDLTQMVQNKKMYTDAIRDYNASLRAYNKQVGEVPLNRFQPTTSDVPLDELLTQPVESEAETLSGLGLYSDDLVQQLMSRKG